MSPWRRPLAAAALALSAGLVCAQWMGWLEPAERALHDGLQARQAEAAGAVRADDVALVEVTDECVVRHGAWPWTRAQVADLIGQIAAAGPSVIAVDLLFLEDQPKQDPRLAEVLRDAGNVVLAGEVVRRTEWDNEAGGLATREVFSHPATALATACAGTGLVNVDFFHDNQDGVVRKMPLAAELDGQLIPLLAVEAAARHRQVEVTRGSDGRVRFGPMVLPYDPPRRTRERAAGAASQLLELAFPASAYVRYERGLAHGLIPTVRALDVLSGEVPPRRFKDRVVLVGIDLRGLDRKVTPLGNLAGVEIQAQVVRNLLTGRLLTRTSPWAARLWLVLAACLGVLLGGRSGRGALAGAALGLAPLLAAHQAHARLDLLLDAFGPALGLALGAGLGRLVVVSLELAARVRNLMALSESSVVFNRTLDLEELLNVVTERYRELTEARAAGVVWVPGEGAEPVASFQQDLDAGVRARMAGRRLQVEVLEMLQEGRRAVPASRLGELSEYPSDAPPPAGMWILPLARFDEVRGFVLIDHPGRVPDPGADPGRFWPTHGSVAATSLENAGLYRMATVDALTTLYIRHYFDVSLARELARVTRHHGQVALLLTDVDHFKKFNDTHGHQVGDQVLRFVAEQVQAAVRDVDIACRYGGEEFAVILPDTDEAGARRTAERIRSRVEEARVEVGEKSLSVTLSVGVTCSQKSKSRSPTAFVEEADQALYRAKENGRNRVEVFEPRD